MDVSHGCFLDEKTTIVFAKEAANTYNTLVLFNDAARSSFVGLATDGDRRFSMVLRDDSLKRLRHIHLWHRNFEVRRRVACSC
jgi:hypothetical protein